MEPIKVDSASNGVGTHVGKHDPIPIPQERQRMLSDNGVQTITCGTKKSRPASQMTQMREVKQRGSTTSQDIHSSRSADIKRM